MRSLRLLSWLLLFIAGALEARPLASERVPEPLVPWVPWVLHGQETRACPFLYNNHENRRCGWPARLELDLGDRKGSFSQSWQVDAESWITLPGDERHWPQEVRLDDHAAVVIRRDGRPALELAPGAHRIRGSFYWDRLPEALAIPLDTGLLALVIKGTPVDSPLLNAEGQLWLGGTETGSKEREGVSNQLEVQVFRRVLDEVPAQIITRLDLEVAGERREVLLGPATLQDSIPLRLDSVLPARLEPDGQLRLQVRPGHWSVEVASRYPRDITAWSMSGAAPPWPESEIWVFDARNHIRLVEVTGLASTDPQQTALPPDWRHLPAYRLQAGDTLSLKLIRRGDPEPEPDRLSLQRDLWLDFDGGGYTIQDSVTGSMTRGWRLEVDPPMSLGRVAVDGAPQLITTRPGSDKAGVEVRRGAIALTADSRYQGDTESLSAGGWDHDFHQLRATLHLPPGWRLFATRGVDNAPTTWLERWTLLDLFLVLIAALATARLWRWPQGLVALVTLALIWHEADAPRYVWLNLLATIALLRILPPGRFRALIGGYRYLSLAALVVSAVPFMVEQVRTGIYPQLERPDAVVAPERQARLAMPAMVPPAAPAEGSVMADRAPAASEDEAKLEIAGGALPKASSRDRAADRLEQIDPKAKVQTGPGLPHWRWTAIDLGWNGPVERGQRMGLVLLSPSTTLLLNLLRVALVSALGLLMFDLSYRSGWQGPSWALALVFVALFIHPGADARADFPDATLLETLKARLLEPPDCLPSCAVIPRLRLEIAPGSLQARMEVHAQQDLAVPLPGHASQWLPSQVWVDGAAEAGVFRTPEGDLWLKLGRGSHQITLAGALPARNSLQLPLPLRPERVELKAEGWLVEGVHEDGVPDPQLQLSRVGTGSAAPPSLEPATLPGFVRIERTLRLGLDWHVETQVVRLSPPGKPVVLELPLIEGEAVTTGQVRVDQAKVLVSMAAGQESMAWESVLEKRPELRLTAPDTTAWTELWRADISPIWHAEPTGIPVVHHQHPNGRWLPQWRPWPGETVVLALSRPAGIEGQTLTIDSSHLSLSPGQRATDASLSLSLRSSQGGQHSLELPQGARLQSVTINGTAQPIRQEGTRVTLPVTPGAQTAVLNWRAALGMDTLFGSPVLDLGMASVNSTVEIILGQDRWVLWTAGPQLGPAVLFWGVLVVLVVVAAGLGRIRLTPLKTRQWFLLGVGLSQSTIGSALLVVGWLMALGVRARLPMETSPGRFAAIQVGLAALTLVALSLLFDTVQQGLLGLPEMQIAGNGSTPYDLKWYQDRSQAQLPRVWLVSAPLLAYRLLMLAWALWLALALLSWLRWGWSCFTSQGLWRPLRGSRKRATETEPIPQP